MGQYIINNPIIPNCCTSIIKDMISAGIKNSEVLHWYLNNKGVRQDEGKLSILITNNSTIAVSLNTLCDILKEHNKIFAHTSSESNLASGVAIHSAEDPKVHTYIVNAISSSLKGIHRSNEELCEALKNSVRVYKEIGNGIKRSYRMSSII